MSTPKGVNSKANVKKKITVRNVLSEVSQGYGIDAISYNFFSDDLEENMRSLVITSAYQKKKGMISSS